MNEHYGEKWRRWPGGCKCHGQGAGYMMSYRALFDSIFDKIERPKRHYPNETNTYFLAVATEGDADETFRWSFGFFSWTPYGELWEQYRTGLSPTRARAEAECRRAGEAFLDRVAAL